MTTQPARDRRRIDSWIEWRRPNTLRNRLIVLMVCLVVLLLWILIVFSETVLERRFEQLLSDEQFATTRYVAAELEAKLADRIEALTRAAALVPVDRVDDPQALDPFLSRLPALHLMFSGGLTVIGLDGRTIADFPVVPGRRGRYFGDREYFRQVLASGRPWIDKPIMGRALRRPVMTIAVAVRDRSERLCAVMTGIIDLTAPNFLGLIGDRAVTGSSELFVSSRRDQMVVAATDGTRAMSAVAERGRNRLYDRFEDGFEGSGIAASSRGISKLYSGKRIPSADWLVVAAMPTETAFAPIRAMRNYLYGAAAVLTLLAVVAVRFTVRRVLAPLEEIGQAMQRMAGGDAPLESLPVRRDDEVGRLVAHFNRLVDDRRCYEAALADSEQRFRMLVEHAPDAILVQTGGRFAYINPAGLALFGAAAEDELLGQAVVSRVHPEDRAIVIDRIRRANIDGESSLAAERRFLRFDGTVVAAEVSSVACRYGGEAGAVVFARDISARKRLEEERAEQARRMAQLSRRLVSLQEEERRHLARELHDRTSPNLAAISLTVAAISTEAPAATAERSTALEDLAALVEDTNAGVRQICTELRPALLDYAGLVPALEGYARQFEQRTGVPVCVAAAAPARLTADVESTLFRIAQEALTNCAKHAKATAVRIDVDAQQGYAVLSIADNGVGFDVTHVGQGAAAGLGLLNMRERVEFLGGSFRLTSQPGAGTEIHVTI